MSTPTHAITVIAPQPEYQLDADFTALLRRHGATPVSVRSLPVARTLAGKRTVKTVVLAGDFDATGLAQVLAEQAAQRSIDLVLQSRSSRLETYRLAVFDMDSTLIQCEVIDELAARAGVGAEVAAITERAMRGELDFDASFTERVAMLAGLPETVLADIAAQLPITEGLAEMMVTLRARGIRTAILSGGFNYFAQQLKARFGFDEVHANTLDIEAGCATGRVVPPIVNGARKREALLKLASELGVGTDQVIAVGDGANDLPMLSVAGLGVAFHAKPVVRAQAAYSLSHVGLDGLLYLFGSTSEWDIGG